MLVQHPPVVKVHHKFSDGLGTDEDAVFRVVKDILYTVIKGFFVRHPIDDDTCVYKGSHDLNCALRTGSTTMSSPACSLAYLILLLLGVFFELMATFSALVVFFFVVVTSILLLIATFIV